MIQHLVDFSEKYTKISLIFSHCIYRPEPGPQVCSTTDSAPRVTQSSAEKGTRYVQAHVNIEEKENRMKNIIMKEIVKQIKKGTKYLREKDERGRRRRRLSLLNK